MAAGSCGTRAGVCWCGGGWCASVADLRVESSRLIVNLRRARYCHPGEEDEGG